MSTAPTIVALTDLSERSDGAIARALQLAGEMSCSLHVLYVSEEIPQAFFAAVEPMHRARIAVVEADLQRQAEASQVQLHFATRTGTVFAETLLYAQDVRARLIVAGKDVYRRPGTRLLPINDTIHKLARFCDRPLLVTKRGKTAYRNALALVDLSDNSAAGLFAASQILPATATLSALYCVDVPIYPTFGELWPTPPVDYTPLRTNAVDEGRRQLDAFLAEHVAGERGVAPVVETGMPVERALRFAESHDCDLVAVGTRGRSAFAAIMLGSIAEGMLELAPCDVLVAPPPGKVFRPS